MLISSNSTGNVQYVNPCTFVEEAIKTVNYLHNIAFYFNLFCYNRLFGRFRLNMRKATTLLEWNGGNDCFSGRV